MARSFIFAMLLALSPMNLQRPVQKPEITMQSKEEIAIRSVIETQRNAWNRGDIDAFMDGYDRSDDTVFVSGDSVTKGWQTVLDHYKKTYDTPDKMGTLTFTILDVDMLGHDSAVVLGRWSLKRSADEPHGTFTLIFRKTSKGWKIVHDHTSSAVTEP